MYLFKVIIEKSGDMFFVKVVLYGIGIMFGYCYLFGKNSLQVCQCICVESVDMFQWFYGEVFVLCYFREKVGKLNFLFFCISWLMLKIDLVLYI